MKFTEQLRSWYDLNKRDLPWRRTKDPYMIWLSEIIMQQTRIEQGTPYYERFITEYPSVWHLAAAEEQEVLKIWQGLGYYSRARNLHATARFIVSNFGGNFPSTYPEIRRLKGVGDYTAAAIASICFDLPHAVMDGNVMRFVSRYFGIVESIDEPGTKKKIRAIAEAQMDHTSPGDFNQAMMEFGAIYCTSANPDCPRCLFGDTCIAFKSKMVDKIPVRDSRSAIRRRFIHYLVLTVTSDGKDYIYLNKRTGNDIWKNLYDFPSLERPDDTMEPGWPQAEFAALFNSGSVILREISGQYIHLLTHQRLYATFYRYHSAKPLNLPLLLVPLKDIHQYPVPKLIDRYLAQKFINLCLETR